MRLFLTSPERIVNIARSLRPFQRVFVTRWGSKEVTSFALTCNVEKDLQSLRFSLKGPNKMTEVREIPIGKIKVGEHDQRISVDDEGMDGLVVSIRSLGLLYPCIVVPEGDEFLLVEGHRRLAACKKLDKPTILCRVEEPSVKRATEIAFAGNFFRKELTSVELASAINDALENKVHTVAELATYFHRSEHWVNSMVAICSWPADVLSAMHNNGISIAAASNLALVTEDVYRDFLLKNAIEGGVSARTTAAWLQAWRTMQPQEEAVTAEPVAGTVPPVPMVPQAPCFCCSTVFPVNEMSHIPVCGSCVQVLRQGGS